MITPEIKILTEKKLTGFRLRMSLTNNKTGELWKNLMIRKQEIIHAKGTDRYSVQVYQASYFKNFDPSAEFEKWATIEVPDFSDTPGQMENFILPGGLYAVFHYKGSSADTRIFHYIFSEWLPQSSYQLDDRPHFEVLGARYKNNDPESEEEIWVPVKVK